MSKPTPIRNSCEQCLQPNGFRSATKSTPIRVSNTFNRTDFDHCQCQHNSCRKFLGEGHQRRTNMDVGRTDDGQNVTPGFVRGCHTAQFPSPLEHSKKQLQLLQAHTSVSQGVMTIDNDDGRAALQSQNMRPSRNTPSPSEAQLMGEAAGGGRSPPSASLADLLQLQPSTAGTHISQPGRHGN